MFSCIPVVRRPLTMPASQARCEALTALVGMPVGLEAGGLRSPHPLLPQLALTGLLALLELKKRS